MMYTLVLFYTRTLVAKYLYVKNLHTLALYENELYEK